MENIKKERIKKGLNLAHGCNQNSSIPISWLLPMQPKDHSSPHGLTKQKPLLPLVFFPLYEKKVKTTIKLKKTKCKMKQKKRK